MRALLAHDEVDLANEPTAAKAVSREAFDRLLGELRPKLHRYCARMTGSVIDGEDVLQETLVKAIEAFPGAGPIANPEGWLFRIAHNAALDFLRRRARRETAGLDEEADMIVDPANPVADRRDRRRQPAHLHAAAARAAQQRHPDGRARLFPAGDRRHAGQQRRLGEGGAASRPRAPARIGREPDDRPLPVLTEPQRSLFQLPMWTASTRATSTPYATCWPTR